MLNCIHSCTNTQVIGYSLQPTRLPTSLSAAGKSIDYDPRGHFYIDAESGLISLRRDRPIDCESMSRYQFEVVAMDEGQPTSRHGRAVVRVTCDNVNDSPPYFLLSPDKLRFDIFDTVCVLYFLSF